MIQRVGMLVFSLVVFGLALCAGFLALGPLLHASDSSSPAAVATPATTEHTAAVPPALTLALEATADSMPGAALAPSLQPTSSPTPTPTLTSTPTPTATPSPTPTSAPTLTSTPTPTLTPPPTATPTTTPSPKATSTPRNTPVPKPSSTAIPTSPPATPTELPTTPEMLPAPQLVYPQEATWFQEPDIVDLRWEPVEGLPEDAYYVLTVSFAHFGQTWLDEAPWLKEVSWRLSDHAYLPSLSDDGVFRWSVQIMRQTGVDAQGMPVGVPASPPSEEWTFSWTTKR